MKIILLAITFLFFFNFSFSQNSETLISSRPGQAFAPDVLGTGIFQLQSGFSYSDEDLGYELTTLLVHMKTFSHNSLLRYGLSKNVDLRTSLTWSRDNFIPEDFPNDVNVGIKEIEVGARYNILDGSSTSSKFAVQADFGLPLRTGSFRSEIFSYDLLAIYHTPLFGAFALTSNLGLENSTFSSGAIGKYVVNVSFSINDNLSAFIENYGSYSRQAFDKFRTFFDGGFALIMNEDVQWDISFGYSDNAHASIVLDRQWFIDSGVSIRFK